MHSRVYKIACSRISRIRDALHLKIVRDGLLSRAFSTVRRCDNILERYRIGTSRGHDITELRRLSNMEVLERTKHKVWEAKLIVGVSL